MENWNHLVSVTVSFFNQIYNIIPWIMKFLPGPHQTLFSNWEKLKMFVAHVIENHRRDWNPAEARDFIDAYLREIEKVRKPEFPKFFILKRK